MLCLPPKPCYFEWVVKNFLSQSDDPAVVNLGEGLLEDPDQRPVIRDNLEMRDSFEEVFALCDSPDDGSKFQLQGGVVLFCGGERS